ncbi:hypothetical protein LC55x_0516 [Lysobacter capsici]|nr:hypothetical protein LC55x_0516 [Lysobacter capsici]
MNVLCERWVDGCGVGVRSRCFAVGVVMWGSCLVVGCERGLE